MWLIMLLPITAEADSAAGVESFELSEAQLGGEEVKLRPVKFNMVNCLSVFIADNVGDEDATVVQKVTVLGSAGEKMDVKEFKDVSKEQDK